MTRFLQLHYLTAYPPANLNRDDTGRPKTAEFGGTTRLRISSQALKRAWRTSDLFKRQLAGKLGERTQRIGAVIRDHLLDRELDESETLRIARAVADVFGKPVSESDRNPTYIEQLAFISPEERAAAVALADRMAKGDEPETKAAVRDVLRTADTAVDIAMFGRMLADNPAYNREAAVQVAHAITTHRTVVEDDYYTAVDDLKRPSEDAGAGFIGETGFGAGVFYLYICIDQDLLVGNLGGDAELAATGISALIEAAATVAPRGKQASFASRAKAGFILAERGESAPRSLAAAFLKPVKPWLHDDRNDDDVMTLSIQRLMNMRDRFAAAYGEELDYQAVDVAAGRASLAELIMFARA
ncbi:type I-E CRISPR-associated protein Cas7/Cse4/CasC [Marinivivus vitaminiproducens]|uniref:type I-E CRISPR-associated protein Cas7/Cse4/CasC n=1 Tax=Marinivivus vitaminiproducens TaxID=3035935 RepID=UPI00279AEA7F|nr:type I-E CRISPR-associated protein Cas7/Cse4/CasC [Geminicoccaceae bacterium SCSIO 64248]